MKKRLITHSHLPTDLEALLQEKRERIQSLGDKDYVTVDRQLQLLNEMTGFELGVFLLKNKGANGYWIHHLLTHPWSNAHQERTDLDNFFLERAPLSLATQERFLIFLREIQKSVKDGARLASIPSGLLGELLYLDLKGHSDVQLIGIDYDEETLRDAKELADKRGLAHCIELHKADAWELNLSDSFDLISSNGLNIYEPDDTKVTALYKVFHDALKPGGKLVTSFATPPPQLTDCCEWKMDRINKEDLLLQRIIHSDILEAKWQCFRSSEQTKKQLESAGFQDIRFIYDRAHLYPTVIALKEK